MVMMIYNENARQVLLIREAIKWLVAVQIACHQKPIALHRCDVKSWWSLLKQETCVWAVCWCKRVLNVWRSRLQNGSCYAWSKKRWYCSRTCMLIWAIFHLRSIARILIAGANGMLILRHSSSKKFETTHDMYFLILNKAIGDSLETWFLLSHVTEFGNRLKAAKIAAVKRPCYR